MPARQTQTRPATGRHRALNHNEAARPASPGRLALRWLREVAIVVVAALVLSFILKTFFIQSFTIPSKSMEDTLMVGDRVIVTKLAPGMLSLHRGDIVVFKDPGEWVVNPEPKTNPSPFRVALQAIGLLAADSDDYLIKRVIGLPGDHVSCEGPEGLLTVNGAELHETYLPPGMSPCQQQFDVTVPAGGLWVMGDNRANSSDSRFHMSDKPLGGAVDEDLVVGVAQLRSWPMNRWALLRNPGDVFRNVPTSQGDSK